MSFNGIHIHIYMHYYIIKGIFHQKMKILSSFIHPSYVYV